MGRISGCYISSGCRRVDRTRSIFRAQLPHSFITNGAVLTLPPIVKLADGTASTVGIGSSRACMCRWAPYDRNHGSGQGQLPVSTIKAPGHRYPDAWGSTRPSTKVGAKASKRNRSQNAAIRPHEGVALLVGPARDDHVLAGVAVRPGIGHEIEHDDADLLQVLASAARQQKVPYAPVHLVGVAARDRSADARIAGEIENEIALARVFRGLVDVSVDE